MGLRHDYKAADELRGLEAECRRQDAADKRPNEELEREITRFRQEAKECYERGLMECARLAIDNMLALKYRLARRKT